MAFSSDAGLTTEAANGIIALFQPYFPDTIKNEQYTINSDGSMVNGTGLTQYKIEKNKISKEGNNKYIIDFPTDGFEQNQYFTITGMKEAYTFTDTKTAAAEAYIVINIMGKSYNLYIYQNGTFATTQQQ